MSESISESQVSEVGPVSTVIKVSAQWPALRLRPVDSDVELDID